MKFLIIEDLPLAISSTKPQKKTQESFSLNMRFYLVTTKRLSFALSLLRASGKCFSMKGRLHIIFSSSFLFYLASQQFLEFEATLINPIIWQIVFCIMGCVRLRCTPLTPAKWGAAWWLWKSLPSYLG